MKYEAVFTGNGNILDLVSVDHHIWDLNRATALAVFITVSANNITLQNWLDSYLIRNMHRVVCALFFYIFNKREEIWCIN